jgi:hypothetical protein
MASQKQVAANRANATHSTGPKTAAGKMKSSRNSFRHGLSTLLPMDVAGSSKANEIARLLSAENACATDAAVVFARAHVELLQIRAIRTEMLVSIDLGSATAGQLQRLVALDRYERYAQTKQWQAASNIGI